MNLLRRFLLHVLADDICALIQAALDDAEIRTFLDGEEIAGIARREIFRNTAQLADALSRQRCGKD